MNMPFSHLAGSVLVGISLSFLFLRVVIEVKRELRTPQPEASGVTTWQS
ncbi:hypothetical protein [Uliginosibacterium sediminicola]|uniref:Uncharacterized protein n=1 Tax=Uliginosibacterium sediminicola TaxID=2024550 RepID=A0ABU9Z2E1_9RHOO